MLNTPVRVCSYGLFYVLKVLGRTWSTIECGKGAHFFYVLSNG